MSNYTHFSLLGYQKAMHPSQSRGTVNPLGRISPYDIEQEARDEQERRQREDQQRIEDERLRRKRAIREKFTESFGAVESFGGKMSKDIFNVDGTTIIPFTRKSGRLTTKKDLQDQLADSSKSVVLFYAPWCGHCKSFKPVYASAASLLEKNDDVQFLMIDCEENSDLAQSYGITGFPTVRFFTSDTSSEDGMDYDGPRSANALVSFINSQ